jgi:hypothetical protein
MRRVAFALLTVLCLAGPAMAGEGGAPSAPKNATLLMSTVALPIVVDGKLVNFIYVTLRLGLSAQADAPKLRDKEPYFRDDLVRAGFRNPFVVPGNYAVLDDNRLKATILRDAATLAGPGMVVSVQIVREQSQHFVGHARTGDPAQR